MGATLVSIMLCLTWLLFLPFSVWGMAILIGVGALIMTLIGHPDDVVLTGITTAVVMVVAGINPENAWAQPILRLADTVTGVAVGVAFAWIAMRITRWNKASH
jgi:hypothetical protein